MYFQIKESINTIYPHFTFILACTFDMPTPTEFLNSFLCIFDQNQTSQNNMQRHECTFMVVDLYLILFLIKLLFPKFKFPQNAKLITFSYFKNMQNLGCYICGLTSGKRQKHKKPKQILKAHFFRPDSTQINILVKKLISRIKFL